MKKVLLTLGLVLTMSFAVNAQDGFIRNEGENDRPTNEGPGIGLPNHGETTDQSAPLGGGLLILTALGAGYALRNKNRE